MERERGEEFVSGKGVVCERGGGGAMYLERTCSRPRHS